jgi:cystathionine gamma-synthase
VSTPEQPKNDRGASTTAIHGGEKRPRAGNSITTPIFQTATYVFRDTAELVDYMSGNTEREEYGRYGNPTQRIAEEKCAAIEGAEAGLAFASGMAAITTTLLAILQSGQHVVLTDDCYRRTRQFCRTVLAKFGVDVTIVETGNDAALEAAITPRTRVLISESPTNPYNKIVDLGRIAEIGRKHRVLTIIDSTLGTPVNQRPIEHGIDLVLHSATKFLAGHNDVLGGIILGNASVIEAIRQYQGILGAILDPHAAYLLIRGLKTLPLRVEQHNRSAQRIAEMLATHPRVERVHYAGLPSHPGHEIARRQM